MSECKLVTRKEAQRIVDYHDRHWAEHEEKRQKKHEIKPCESCGGTGKVKLFLRKPVPHEREETCLNCHGWGEIVLYPQPFFPRIYPEDYRLAKTILSLTEPQQ